MEQNTQGRLAALVASVRHFVNRHHLWLGVMFGVLVVTTLLQLVYPRDRALPFSTFQGQSTSLKSVDETAELIGEQYDSAVLITDNPLSEVTFGKAGIRVDAVASAQRLIDYPLWQRLIPFSGVWRLTQPTPAVIASYNPAELSIWAKELAADCDQPAKDASVAVQDGQLVLVPSQDGRSCDRNKLVDNLKQTRLLPKTQLATGAVTIAPQRSDEDVNSQLDSLRQAVKEGLSLQILDSITQADKTEVVSWLTFTDKDGQLQLAIDPEKVEPFLKRAEQPVYIPPGITTIYQRDGIETGRITGLDGQGIDREKTIVAIEKHLRDKADGPVQATLAKLPPTVRYLRSYTYSQRGLEALLDTITDAQPDMSISVTQLDGQRLSANSRGDRQYHPASTYKLVVAVTVIQHIEAGQLKWSSQINGMTVQQCMEKMIVVSDNACAHAFGEKFDWAGVQSTAAGIGMNRTNLNATDFISTTNDQVKLLTQLQRGQLMNDKNRNKLLSFMKQQVYRGGIPAGVNATVADKVGFLEGLLHDSAIIYAPSGTYVLSIYSDGGSWSDIADAARQINELIGS